MKFNKWTLSLAAIGVVSLASAAQADEKMSAVQSALSSTTISGYVDTSAQWNVGTGTGSSGTANEYAPPYKFGGPAKADGFNLNVVQLTIAKPLDESEWASGYRADLWFGPDANTLGTQSFFSSGSSSSYASQGDFAIRQAYVALRAPVGNGLDLKMGVFDSIIGYESLESGNNPNFTRSWGNSIEPQTMTGVLASYRVNDVLSMSAGVANSTGPTINGRNISPDEGTQMKAESYKTYMGSIALTAPDSMGWAAGSTLYAGVVNGFNENENGSDYDDNSTSWYVGGTLATPVTGLKVGAAFDYLNVHNWQSYNGGNGDVWSVAGYTSYQATEKLSLHLRGEYLDDRAYFFSSLDKVTVFTGTATAQYDLWKNVISRLEFRWDHSCSGIKYFGGGAYNYSYETYAPTRINSYILALNVIYKF